MVKFKRLTIELMVEIKNNTSNLKNSKIFL